jgi:hypothetical protein
MRHDESACGERCIAETLSTHAEELQIKQRYQAVKEFASIVKPLRGCRGSVCTRSISDSKLHRYHTLIWITQCILKSLSLARVLYG